MATQAELEQSRRALNAISRRAKADVNGVIRDALAAGDTAAVMRSLIGVYPDVVGEYGAASAALGADMVEAWADDLRVRPSLRMARPLDASAARAAAEWALSRSAGSLDVMTDKLVKDPYRITIQASSEASGVGWARVPMGAKSCAFCLVVASRGITYKTEQTAGGGTPYHGGCDCQVVMARSEDDLPPEYDLVGIRDVYAQARMHAEHPSSAASILSELRKITGGH